MTEQIDYFQKELQSLRESVGDFSAAYPTAAAELGLSAGQSADPHVEQLLQSFAWLTSRLRCDLEQQRQEIPNHLLMSLYPQLMQSVPCMTVMQAQVLADGANFVNGYTLEKDRLFSIWSSEHRGADGREKQPVECRLQCCYNTPLWPFTIEDIAVKPNNIYPCLDGRTDISSVIAIDISSDGSDPIYEYPLASLRFFIADAAVRKPLYQALANHLAGVVIRYGDHFIELEQADLQWLGFADEHNVLPQPLGVHNAYRLLMEYFYFSEKFYFFELQGLDLGHAVDHFEVLLLLDNDSPSLRLQRDSLSINSFPVINLFPASFKPLPLDYRCYEYRLLANEAQYGQSEVHSVTQVRLIAADGKVSHAQPWLGGVSASETELKSHLEAVNDSELSYLTRIVPTLSPGTAGCDTMLALYNGALCPETPVDQTLVTKGLCSNRILPESLRIGDSLKLLGPGALVEARLISRPTLFKAPKLQGESTVKLLSQLHLNQLSLAGEQAAGFSLQRFKQLLSLYCDTLTPTHRRQLDGIVDLEIRPSVRRLGKEAWRGHYQGSHITLTLDEAYFDSDFDSANGLLLGEVLSHFLGLYTTLNHFVQLQLVSYQREGVWKQWPPRIGEQIIL